MAGTPNPPAKSMMAPAKSRAHMRTCGSRSVRVVAPQPAGPGADGLQVEAGGCAAGPGVPVRPGRPHGLETVQWRRNPVPPPGRSPRRGGVEYKGTPFRASGTRQTVTAERIIAAVRGSGAEEWCEVQG